jgi:predicted CXXCH cytochrome family protein
VLAAIAAAASFALVIFALPTIRRAARHQTKIHVVSVVRAATFVGATACGKCHHREFKLWKGSHHELAMLPASASSVLGDFNDASISDGDITSRFFRRGGKFMVRTEGPDGALHNYQIKFTFGVSPLQQYLIELPGGRLQAFSTAWDSRPRSEGGQRWFSLHPGQKMRPSDPLFWSGLDANWNYMCADCHSTNVRKNYHPGTRTFTTTYTEINVACEACHGPGSNHVAWAEKRGDWRRFDGDEGLLIALNERRRGTWKIDPKTGNVVRSVPRKSESEIQMCARCHSRRGKIHEDYVHGQTVGDDYRAALLDHDLYFPDGQIKGEVYEYGSFIQSRMYNAGVTCSNCHDPHSLRLRAKGNGVCLQCHAVKYDSASHYFHKPGSPGSQCVQCHMPTRTYMLVDARRDHSMRVPRPALSLALGVPNACNECHRDKSAAWAARTVAKWYGHQPVGFQRFAQALHGGSIGAPGGLKRLAALVANHDQPAIACASALALMATYPASATINSVRIGVRDPSPLVRRAAARALASADPGTRAKVLAPFLDDPVRAVRLEAAEVMAGTPVDALPDGAEAALSKAIDEYVVAQELNADSPEAHLDLASLFAREQHFSRAARELRTALSLDPTFTPAAVNLADLDRELGRDDEGEQVLRAAIVRSPNDAALQYSLGLLLVRRGHQGEAMGRLAAAARLDPTNARFMYVYAVALNDRGQTDEAIRVLEASVARHPYDRESLAALTNFYRRAGDPGKALQYAKRLSELGPNGPPRRQERNEQ